MCFVGLRRFSLIFIVSRWMRGALYSCLHLCTNCWKCLCLWNLIAEISRLFAFLCTKHDEIWLFCRTIWELQCCIQLTLALLLLLLWSVYCFRCNWCVFFSCDLFASLKTLSQHQLRWLCQIAYFILWIERFDNVVERRHQLDEWVVKCNNEKDFVYFDIVILWLSAMPLIIFSFSLRL